MQKRSIYLNITFLILIVFYHSTGYGQTQIEINKLANDSYKKADSELNVVYKKIILLYKSDSVFIKNLIASQKIWITFRDAELKMMYPEREPGYYGSIHPTCVANYLEKLTKERIVTLKLWLEGVEEGDACSGSVKRKDLVNPR